MQDGDNQFKINFQRFNGFVTFKVRSGELLYITFLYDGLSTIELYPEVIDPESFYFQGPARTKITMHVLEYFEIS